MPVYKVPVDGEFVVEADTPEQARRYAAGWLFLMMERGRPRRRPGPVRGMFPVHALGVSGRGVQEVEQEGPSAGPPPREFLDMTGPPG